MIYNLYVNGNLVSEVKNWKYTKYFIRPYECISYVVFVDILSKFDFNLDVV